MRKHLAFVTTALLAAQPACAATVIYNFTVDGSSTGLGAGPFGTVSVTENSNGSLTFLETLASGFSIHKAPDANHNAFDFSILGNPLVTVSALTSGFAAISTDTGTSVNAPPFGPFFTAIRCTSCTSPGSNAYSGLLSFTVSAPNPLTLASLSYNTANGYNVYFATDLINNAGQTGNVGAAGVVAAVPEPATWALMLVGFGGVGYTMRRRKPVIKTTVSA